MKGPTRATTAINSGQPEESPMATCCLGALTSSSTIATSLMTLFAASCASCLAAVVLTEVDEPVSRSRRSRSNLRNNMSHDYGFQMRMDGPGSHYVNGIGLIRLAADRACLVSFFGWKLGAVLTDPPATTDLFIIWAKCDPKLTASRVTRLLALSALFRDALPIAFAKAQTPATMYWRCCYVTSIFLCHTLLLYYGPRLNSQRNGLTAPLKKGN